MCWTWKGNTAVLLGSLGRFFSLPLRLGWDLSILLPADPQSLYFLGFPAVSLAEGCGWFLSAEHSCSLSKRKQIFLFFQCTWPRAQQLLKVKPFVLFADSHRFLKEHKLVHQIGISSRHTWWERAKKFYCSWDMSCEWGRYCGSQTLYRQLWGEF